MKFLKPLLALALLFACAACSRSGITTYLPTQVDVADDGHATVVGLLTDSKGHNYRCVQEYVVGPGTNEIGVPGVKLTIPASQKASCEQIAPNATKDLYVPIRKSDTETWQIDAQASYVVVDGGIQTVSVPAGSATVSVNQCVRKQVRQTQHLKFEIPEIAQEFCVYRFGDRVDIFGWTYTDEKVSNALFDPDAFELNTGKPISISLYGGTEAHAKSGVFTINAVQVSK